MMSIPNILIGVQSGILWRWQDEENGSVPILVWIFIFVALALFVAFVIWWYRRGPTAESPSLESREGIAEVEPMEPTLAAELETRAATLEAPAGPDDLELVEGIGPKAAAILQAAGITTFAQLATTDVARLREILAAAKLRLLDPATWPEQAKLAAAGDWAGFEALQQELRGGRRG